MKLIILSLLVTFLSSTLVHADLSDEIPIVNNLQTPEALAAASLGQNLIGTIFAYWPHRHTHPSPRIVRLTGEDGLTHNYIAVFKDPADNAYDLSNEEEVYAALKEEDMISKAERISGLSRNFQSTDVSSDIPVLFSVYLDHDDKKLYSLPGREVPSSWRDIRTYNQVVGRMIIEGVDPNTPGLEDIKDPGQAMAQIFLNTLALQGPEVLASAKTNPIFMATLDAAFEHSRKHEQLMAELDAKVEAEEAAQGGIKEKRGKWAQSHQE